MEYNSLSKVTQNLSIALLRPVTTQEVRQVLKQLNCLDEYNYPTITALGCGLCKMRNDYRGREYPTWSEEVEREVYEILLERTNKR